MAIAAVPDYLGSDFRTASPGLRFAMYLKLWTKDDKSETSWAIQTDNKTAALHEATVLTDNDKAIMQALLARQQQAFSSIYDDAALVLDAQAIAPFTTGLGNEHPLENGFAFLNPYGLPYLPASGVKGVLRQAARELASGDWGDCHGWTDAYINVLFGLENGEGSKAQLRGSLIFWDVIPQIKGKHLAVEIMTPHQKHYYQDGQTPHDSGLPIPLTFLAVPPGAEFTFHVQCNLDLLRRNAPELTEASHWKTLLSYAFSHAFQWLGFGAKTSVGYGAMSENPVRKARREEQQRMAQEARRKAQEQEERQKALASLGPEDRAIAECLDARVDKNQPEINALIAGLSKNIWPEELRPGIALRIKEKMEAEGKWTPISKKKKPEKDKDHQNTKLVMSYL